MAGLEQTFYIMGIVYMSLTFVLILALAVAVLVIRAKINAIHDKVEDKIDAIVAVAQVGGGISAAAEQVKNALTSKKK